LINASSNSEPFYPGACFKKKVYPRSVISLFSLSVSCKRKGKVIYDAYFPFFVLSKKIFALPGNDMTAMSQCHAHPDIAVLVNDLGLPSPRNQNISKASFPDSK
jgi:hypothetical protein